MMARFETAYEAYMQELRKTASVELLVREVPLQLTGPIPEGSLREALEPLAPGAPPSPAPLPTAGPGATDTSVIPTENQPVPAPAADEEITTTPQAGPEKVAPPPPPAVPTPTEPPPPGR
jgi:hypothetical protein